MKIISVLALLFIARVATAQQCITGPNNVVVTAVNNSQVTLTWGSVPAVPGWDFYSTTLYFVHYGVGNVATTLTPGTAGNTATVSGLALGTTYTFQVFAACSCGLSDGSGITANDNGPVSNFVTATIAPGVPALAAGSSTSSSSITCAWNTVAGATGYDVEVTNSANTVVSNPTNVAGVAFAAAGLTSNTPYFYRVRARNAGGVSVYSAKSPAVLALPAAPSFPVPSFSSVTTTSSQLSWNAVPGPGAATYQLDVAADNNFLSAFITNNQPVAGTTAPIAGLQGGTTYFYRVRAVNTSGTSVNSVTNQVLTAPVAPASFVMSATTPTSSTATWSAAPSATQYELSVALDVNFSFPVANYNPKVIAAPTLTETINNLAPSTNYFLRLRAKNGASSYSAYIFSSVLTPTPPSAPTFSATPFSEITTTSCKLSWNVVGTAASYRLDVSDDPTFNSFITNDLVVNGTTSPTIAGLAGGTTYYFRVRAVDGGGVPSVNSAVVQTLTAPITPGGFTVSGTTATSISVNWAASPTATQYELFVSVDPNFATFITNYNPKIIAAITLSDGVNGLTTSTTYYLRVRARNGASSYSDYANTSAVPGNGGAGIQFNIPSLTSHAAGVAQSISADITGNSGATSVTLYHKKNSESAFTAEPVTVVNGTQYSVALNDSWFDDFGMEFYFSVHDQVSDVSSAHAGVPTGVANVIVPFAQSGNQVADYQIISIPYTLPGRTHVSDVFEQVMGDYDKKKWRLFRYQDGSNVEYSDGIKGSDLAQGEAFWLISKAPVTLNLGQGVSNNAVNDRTPFTLTLKKGWNQIGNPFPHDVSWQDVQAANGSADIDPALLIFDHDKVSFVSGDVLPAFGGGFVFANNDTQLLFSATLDAIGGRVAHDPNGLVAPNAVIDDWFLPIQVRQDEINNSLGGIGMNVSASDEKDKLDQVAPPHFMRYAELQSTVRSSGYYLSRDVVGSGTEHTWNFNVAANSSDAVELTWDNDLAGGLAGHLTLYDQTNRVVVDMAKRGTYVTTSGARVSIRYSKVAQLEVAELELGRAYPNPFRSAITIPYTYSLGEASQAELVVLDAMGNVVFERIVNTGANQSGVQAITLESLGRSGSDLQAGLYLYRVRVTAGAETQQFTGKLIKE